jgi:hypothetical protein
LGNPGKSGHHANDSTAKPVLYRYLDYCTSHRNAPIGMGFSFVLLAAANQFFSERRQSPGVSERPDPARSGLQENRPRSEFLRFILRYG